MKTHKYYLSGLTQSSVIIGWPGGKENDTLAEGNTGAMIFSMINGIPEGSTMYSRSTKRIYVNNVEINAYIQPQSTTPLPVWGGLVRCILYVNHLGANQQSSVAAGYTWGQLMQSNTNQSNITDLYRPENKHIYTILSDRVYDLPAIAEAYNTTTTTMQTLQKRANVRLNIPVGRYFRYLPAAFVGGSNFNLNGVTSSCNSTDIQTTSATGAGQRNYVEEDLCLLIVSDANGWTATTCPILQSLTWRTNFQDF